MPTLARSERADRTRAALRSVLEQERCQPHPLVVVNGPAPDAGLLNELEADPRIQVVRLPRAGLAGALHEGRLAVSTPWVSALDDDDLLLPGSLAARIDRLEAESTLDVVIGNGLRRVSGVDTPHWPDPERIRQEPLTTMAEANWMLPGAWLARSERVGAEAFARAPYGAECTYLGLYFAIHHRTDFLEEPVVVWQEDTPESISKSRDYVARQGEAITRILELELPDAPRAAFLRKRTDAFHTMADLFRREGNLRDAWYWHGRTLVSPGGWRYGSFGRRLLQTWLARSSR